MFDQRQVITVVDHWIVNRTVPVIAAFLVLTGIFAVGLGSVSSEAGTNQFTESSPAQAAFDDVNSKFGPAFGQDTGSTQLIQTSQNVLSQRGLLRMLRAQRDLAERQSLRVSSTDSPARIVARQIDPSAATLEEQIWVVESATPTEIDAAVRELADNPLFTQRLSNDFNPESASASASIGVVKHTIPTGLSSSAGSSGKSPLSVIQVQSAHVVDADENMRVFGSGILSEEFSRIIFDSLILVVPAAVLLILTFLVFAYRDPVDLLLGTVSLVMAIIWTMGAMGLAGIPFTQMLIAVPPLLLAVGIDFGIHSINRYREERIKGFTSTEAMYTTTDQLFVAFFIVTGTTVIGFLANLTSELGPIRDFGLVAGVGIVFTFLIFGIFLPAAKLYTDRLRERVGFPQFGTSPLGREGTLLGAVLPVGVGIARRAPLAFLVLSLSITAGAGYYGTGVDTTFSNEDFLPPEETPSALEQLPEPFAPSEYTVTRDLNFLDEQFESSQQDTVTVYVTGPLRKDYALESIQHASNDPPETFVSDGHQASTTSIITVIQQYAEQSPEFARMVERNDADADGVPDDNLGEIYDTLLSSPARSQALNYITEDQRHTRVIYSVESEKSQEAITEDAKLVADRYRLDGVATGTTVVFQSISDMILQSAAKSLAIALGLTIVFLVFIYWALEGRPSLGVVNVVPILSSVALIAGSMRFFGVPFNALTGTTLAISIGLGIDYSAHIVHRFADEYETANDVYEALDRTVRGTGGALTGSMLTTTTGIGVLVIAITPILGQFGLITAMSIFYSYITALVITPSAAVLWDRVIA